MPSLTAIVPSLAAGARSFAARDAAGRAALARATAGAVAAAADRWVEAALDIKRSTGPAAGAARAEETATGPVVTLRLLAITARVFEALARGGLPPVAGRPRLLHAPRGGEARFVGVDVLPGPGLWDGTVFGGHSAVVRCANPGGLEAFAGSWRAEAATRPRGGGVCAVLGAGNVTGLAAADALAQVFEHGRAALLKLHPLHAPLEPVLREALGPLVDAGLLAVVSGGADVAREVVQDPGVTHVHMTGGRGAFDALVWGGPGPRPPGTAPALAKPVTCELGNVTPWIVVPGRYAPRQLAAQADMLAASIANNTSFNCIATKCIVTARGWAQRDEFLGRIRGRLESLPARPAWYPGAAAAWGQLAGRPAPADGTLPVILRSDVDPAAEPHWLEREWFLPAAVEVPLEAASVDAFCGAAGDFVHALPGSLAASITAPDTLAAHDAVRVDLLAEHLAYGVVARNTWSALAYALASVPWGGYPGATLTDPGSGIGHVHDPLLLPLVHNTIVRGPLAPRPTPPWLPWHPHGPRLARGVVDVYAALAAGRGAAWHMLRMLPKVLAG
jgi:acyl-CoA reductase-like NAD-dependent aldehyde dehydrogenase